MPKAIEIEKMTPAKTRKKCEIRSKLTIKTPEKRRIFIFNFSRKGVNIYIYIYIYIYINIYIYIYIYIFIYIHIYIYLIGIHSMLG